MDFFFKNRLLSSHNKPLIMGIHNATPDSFSDGGDYENIEREIEHCCLMLDEGADIIDIGGESTNPNDSSSVLSSDDELARIIPIIKGVKKIRPESVISVDTFKADVAYEAVKNGADIVNDVSGLKYSEKMGDVVAKTGAFLVLMHMKFLPKSKNEFRKSDNIMYEVKTSLSECVEKALKCGVNLSKIIIDPGIGGGCFGKNTNENVQLLSSISELKKIKCPILIGASRKGFIGEILGEPNPKKRINGNLAVASWCFMNNVDILRVHDVCQTRQLLKILEVLRNIN